MVGKPLIFLAVLISLALMAACANTSQNSRFETVVIKESGQVGQEPEIVITQEIEETSEQIITVEKIVTVEVEKEVPVVETIVVVKPVSVRETVVVEREVPAVQTVVVEKAVPVFETVEVIKLVTVEVIVTPTPTLPPSPTPTPTADLTNSDIKYLLHEMSLVQHHHNPETGVDYFTCASRGQGLAEVSIDPKGARFVGPNAMDFDLWGVTALFRIDPDGQIFLVPQQIGGTFLDPSGTEHDSFTLNQALDLFVSGEARWIGAEGEPGRIAECDPYYATPTPTPRS